MSELIPLADPPVPAAPRLPGTVVVKPELDELLDRMVADLVLHAIGCVRQLGDFHLALSGGSTPLPFYRRLMYDPAAREFPWQRTHLWIVDERRVSFDDDRSNFKAIDELIGQHSGIPRQQVHPMLALAPDADEQYERTLRQTLFWRERGHDRLDYVLLGMGTDAHTASLFPGSPALEASLDDGAGRLVLINEGPKVTPPDRVTMTLPLINAARFVAMMVTGASKRGPVAGVAAAAGVGGEAGPSRADVLRLPVLGVRPRAGELRWYLDAAACP